MREEILQRHLHPGMASPEHTVLLPGRWLFGVTTTSSSFFSPGVEGYPGTPFIYSYLTHLLPRATPFLLASLSFVVKLCPISKMVHFQCSPTLSNYNTMGNLSKYKTKNIKTNATGRSIPCATSGQASTPCSYQAHYYKLMPLASHDSARLLRSSLNFTKSAFINRPNSDGAIRKDKGPRRSSDCVKIVAAPSFAGSILNSWRPATVNTGGPCQAKRFSEFSYRTKLAINCLALYPENR